MKAIGVILILIGVAGTWNGPMDRDYLSDWVGWVFFAIVGMLGLAMLLG